MTNSFFVESSSNECAHIIGFPIKMRKKLIEFLLYKNYIAEEYYNAEIPHIKVTMKNNRYGMDDVVLENLINDFLKAYAIGYQDGQQRGYDEGYNARCYEREE